MGVAEETENKAGKGPTAKPGKIFHSREKQNTMRKDKRHTGNELAWESATKGGVLAAGNEAGRAELNNKD